MSSTPKIALSIAGSDPSGGAGIQADLKVFHAHQVYGCAAISALTAQNTKGVQGVWPVAAATLEAQVSAVLRDMSVGAVKTGMLATVENVQVAARLLQGKALPLVVDPVLRSSGETALAEDGMTAELMKSLLSLATVITPNLDEAAALLGWSRKIGSRETMLEAAQAFMGAGARAVLLKGGHLPNEATDLLLDTSGPRWFEGPRIQTRNTHGTGCALSAALCAQLAMGRPLAEAVRLAKDWLTRALEAAAAEHLGAGSGPPRLWTLPAA